MVRFHLLTTWTSLLRAAFAVDDPGAHPPLHYRPGSLQTLSDSLSVYTPPSRILSTNVKVLSRSSDTYLDYTFHEFNHFNFDCSKISPDFDKIRFVFFIIDCARLHEVDPNTGLSNLHALITTYTSSLESWGWEHKTGFVIFTNTGWMKESTFTTANAVDYLEAVLPGFETPSDRSWVSWDRSPIEIVLRHLMWHVHSLSPALSPHFQIMGNDRSSYRYLSQCIIDNLVPLHMIGCFGSTGRM